MKKFPAKLEKFTEYIDNVTQDRDDLRATLKRLIDLAADFIGTDQEYRSAACIEVAIKHGYDLRADLKKVIAQRDRYAKYLRKAREERDRLRKPSDVGFR